MNPTTVLRRVKEEIAHAITTVEGDPAHHRDARTRGHLEALRHAENIITTIESLEGGVMGWIGVDLDGVLAHWDPAHFPDIGAPIAPMVARVQSWLEDGQEVRIFTARVAIVPGLRNDEGQEADLLFAADQLTRIHIWCEQHIGVILPVTAVKDFHMVELYDDRCVQMITNEGISLKDSLRKDLDELHEMIRTPPSV